MLTHTLATVGPRKTLLWNKHTNKILVQHKQQLTERKTIWTSLDFSNACVPQPFPWVPADIAAYWLEPHRAKRRKIEVLLISIFLFPQPLVCIHYFIWPAAHTGHFLQKPAEGSRAPMTLPTLANLLKPGSTGRETLGPELRQKKKKFPSAFSLLLALCQHSTAPTFPEFSPPLLFPSIFKPKSQNSSSSLVCDAS